MNTVFIILQHLLPQHLLSRLVGRLAECRSPWLKNILISQFIRQYKVNMEEAAADSPQDYANFNDFFTRALRDGARPIDDKAETLCCPADGAISQFGAIDDHHILQAKGHRFTTTQLLAGDAALADRFRHGSFANLYLSPKDYHRLHMPCAGRLQRMIYVPGALFSVNPVTARGVPGLFARNERVVCVFDSETHGPFVMVLVGATIVGSMATTWHGVVNPQRTGAIAEWDYSDQPVVLEQGEEMGRFLLGSTVIMLFEKDVIEFNADWRPEGPVRLGEVMGNRPAR